MESSEDIFSSDKIEYLGLATARFINVVQVDSRHTMVPWNSELKIFSVDTRPPVENSKNEEDKNEIFDARFEFKQSVSTASLMTLRESEKYWVGITHDGEIIMVEKQSVEEI